MANKKEKTEANDVFSTSEAFLVQYKKPVIIAVAAVIILIAGFFSYKSLIAGPREEKASTALGLGSNYFENEMYDKALNGDGANYQGFLKIASDYSGTDAANLANLYAGLCYANLGKWQDAVTYLDKYSPSDDSMVSPAAIAALGNAYAHVGQIDKAISNLKKAADKADGAGKDGVNNSLSPVFLLQAAELLESQNKTAEALELYQNIKKKYVNSSIVQSQEIDKYIERASLK
ncbi:MAG: tetratricopeptide repeat protein [Prevotella sp.]|nr:tetratricopeptide repeat protein [Prevotella sp.]MDY4040139.1 tetratricopeptide repeat protein [Prevotella sp.]